MKPYKTDKGGSTSFTLPPPTRVINKVNCSHLNEEASCFIETTCIKISLNVEAVSPQALISVVPTVLHSNN